MNEKTPDPSPKVGNTSGALAANSVLTPQRKTGFPWFPTITVALVVVGIAAVQWRPELERNLRAWGTAALALLGTLTLLIWFLASSRFRARTRLIGLAIVILCGLALKGTLRVDGTINGTGLPRLVWRGSQSGTVPAAATPTETAKNPVHGAPLLGLEDSAQFLGPDRTGVLPVARFSTNWNTQAPREMWRRPIGLGWSSFAVVDGRVWTQEQVGDDERVICLNVATGQTLWSHSERTRFSEWQGGDGPRATPTVQDGRVYAMGGTGILLCLDAATGKLVWRRSVLEENSLSNLIWGTSSSPLIVDGLTVITGGRGSGAVLYAYRSSDGSPAWKSGDRDASYASPILATLAGRRVIVSNNAESLTAHDPATGRILFNHVWGGSKWPKASQPVVLSGDRVFVSGGYGMGCQIIQVTNGEAGSDRATGTLKTETTWKGITMKTQFNSPGLRNGYLYGLDDGLLACIDADTGRRIWKDGRFGSGQTLIVGDTVVVQNENGTVHLCAASPDGFRELGQIAALSSKTWNQPAVAGRYLLVRNDREAVCWELPAAGR